MWELVDLDNREAIAIAKFVSSYIVEQVKKVITLTLID